MMDGLMLNEEFNYIANKKYLILCLLICRSSTPRVISIPNHENVPLAIQSDNRQTTLPFSPDVNGQVTSSQNGVAENHSNIKEEQMNGDHSISR
jgi:hypothetical protein